MPRRGGVREPLLTAKQRFWRSVSRPDDELQFFRACLRWMCMDQSTPCRAVLSWSLFAVSALAVPFVSHFVLSYNPRRRPFDLVVQLSLTAAAALSFLFLSAAIRRFRLRGFLLLDELCGASPTVRLRYDAELNRSFLLLALFVAPCFAADVAYKIWWYCNGAGRIPFLGNPLLSDAVACALELASWIYRTAIFLLACVLFRLICHLQILRLQDFAAVFHEESEEDVTISTSFPEEAEVRAVLQEHLAVRKHLEKISHRFRGFIVACLALVTASQFAAVLLTTRPSSEINLFNNGELALCSIVLVTGLLICLRSAAKITHRAQALTSRAAKWHAFATIEASDAEPETQSEVNTTPNHLSPIHDEEGESKMVQPNVNTISFQKRQALVMYFEHNKAGITVYGFEMDRTFLRTIFTVELPLFLWLLGKTIGIS